MFWGKERNFSAGFLSGFHLKPQADFRFRGSPGKNELGWKKHMMGGPWQIHSWKVSEVSYTKEQHHVFKAWVCIQQSFFIWWIWYNLSRFYKNPLTEGEEEHYEITESWRLGKTSKIFKSNLQVHPQYPGAAFSLWRFIPLHMLCGIPHGLWILIPKDVCFSEHGWFGKRSGVCNHPVVTLSRVVPVHRAWAGRRNCLRYEQPTDEPPIFSYIKMKSNSITPSMPSHMQYQDLGCTFQSSFSLPTATKVGMENHVASTVSPNNKTESEEQVLL